MLQKTNGEMTGNYAEMDKLLREDWEQTFSLYTSIPKPSWEAFRAHYARFFPSTTPMVRAKLTPARLREVLRNMDPNTSIGPDGWRVRELRKLPMLQRLCDLFEVIEASGKWPKILSLGLITPLD